MPPEKIKNLARGVLATYSRLAVPFLERGEGFSGSVARTIGSARQDRISDPDVDPFMFPDRVARPSHPRQIHSLLRYIHDNSEAVNRTAALFEDEESRELLRQILAYRALGPKHVRLPRNHPDYMQFFERAESFKVAGSGRTFPPFEMARYSVPFAGETIDVECWLGNVVATFLERQYWYERGGVRIAPEGGDVILDVGSCFGDTALAFAATVGAEGHVHSFEPMPRQKAVFDDNLRRNPELAKRITVHPFAASGSSDETLRFMDGGAAARPGEGGNVEVRTITLDDFAQRQALERIDYIKMDIEGAERSAIDGAADLIAKHKPKLAISIYHSLEDLLMIPQLVESRFPFYQLHLGHHTIHTDETILYAVAAG